MSYRIFLGVVGIAVALICGVLTQLGKPSIGVQAGLMLGMATAFLGFGLESISESREPNLPDGGKRKGFRGWVFIAIAMSLATLTLMNLLKILQ